MGKALNVLLGSVATALVTVGVAAQTGTVRWPTFTESRGTVGVPAQQATESPSTEPSPSLSPQPTLAPVAAAPVAVARPAEAPPPERKKHKH